MSQKKKLSQLFPFSLRDLLLSIAIFFCAVECCSFFRLAESSDGFATPVFILAVLLISRFTSGYLFGLVASLLGVICVNYIFTYPYLSLNFTLSGYPLSFLAFFMVSIITSTLTTQAKQQEKLRMENEKEKMRANLLRSVSHDIRTPLTSIVGATSTILDHPTLPPSEQKELLEDVRSDAQWLIQVVENLLSITRIGSDQANIKKEPEAAEEVLGEAGAEIPQTVSTGPGGGPCSPGAFNGPHGPDPHRAGAVQSAGKRRAAREDPLPDRGLRAAGGWMGPLFRVG